MNIQILEDAVKSGFVRARIDGVMASLEDSIKLDKQKKHTIEIVVDRIVVGPDVKKRLADSVETALESSSGIIIVTKRTEEGETEVFFRQGQKKAQRPLQPEKCLPGLWNFHSGTAAKTFFF